MDEETRALRQEVAELRTQIDAVDDWANGIQLALVQLLPLLLRGHPEATNAHRLLQRCDDRYEELLQHPQRAEGPDETHRLYEAAKQLNRQLGMSGAWPGVDATQVAQQSLRRGSLRSEG